MAGKRSRETRKQEERTSEYKMFDECTMPILGSLTGEADPNLYQHHDTESKGSLDLDSQLTPGEAALRRIDWQKVDEAFRRYHTVTIRAIRKIPKMNWQIEECNLRYEREVREYKANRRNADRQIVVLKKKREPLQDLMDKAEIAYRPAEATLEMRKSAVEEVERAKKSLTLVKTEVTPPGVNTLIWTIRATLGIALALSLGLIIGALNQYQPFTPILGVFWVIGSAILFNSGTVVHWLAEKAAEVMEARRYPGAKVPSGNKWTWMLISTIMSFSAVDAATLMFGAFRLLSVSGGTTIPIPILLLVCFIFIFPYLYMEARYGWSEGERKVKDLAGRTIIDSEEKISGITFESITTETADVNKLAVLFEQAKKEVEKVNAEITRIDSSPVMAKYWWPTRFGPGLYTGENQEASATWLSKLIGPPLNEELAVARKDYLETLAIANQRDDELRLKVLSRKSMKAQQPKTETTEKGFFARWLSGQ